MEEKEFIGNRENVDKELAVPTMHDVQSKEVSALTGKELLSNDDNNPQVYEGVMDIAKSLQQSSDGFLEKVLKSPGGNHKTIEDVPTVARLLGEVVSDFLAGLTKNGESPAMQEVRNFMEKLAQLAEQSKLEDTDGGEVLKLLLLMLAEKVKSTSPSRESANTETEQ